VYPQIKGFWINPFESELAEFHHCIKKSSDYLVQKSSQIREDLDFPILKERNPELGSHSWIVDEHSNSSPISRAYQDHPSEIKSHNILPSLKNQLSKTFHGHLGHYSHQRFRAVLSYYNNFVTQWSHKSSSRFCAISVGWWWSCPRQPIFLSLLHNSKITSSYKSDD